MKITRIHHAQSTVPEGSEDEAREFYCGVLGLPEVPKSAALAGRGGFWLGVGDQQVHVGIEPDVNRAVTKAHLAYEVSGLDQWRQALQERGIKVLESVPILGFDRFEFRNPFGNRVEFIEALL